MSEMIRRAINAYIPDPKIQEISLAPDIPPLKIAQSPDNVKPIEVDPFEAYQRIKMRSLNGK